MLNLQLERDTQVLWEQVSESGGNDSAERRARGLNVWIWVRTVIIVIIFHGDFILKNCGKAGSMNFLQF